MFEQSVLRRPHTRSTPAFLLVSAAELAAIAAAVVIPLFFTPPLIEPRLPAVLRFARAVTLVRLDPAKLATAARPTGPVFARPRPFYAPQRVPQKMATTPEIRLPIDLAPNIGAAFTNSGSSVPGAIEQLGVAAAPPRLEWRTSAEQVDRCV